MTNRKQIAIDGPASAGKSTVAKILAEKLGFVYCDTGAMYRSLTLVALNNKVETNQEEALLDLLNGISITFKQMADGQHVFIDDQDVTTQIRGERVTSYVSEVSSFKSVREEMVRRQQKLADKESIIMDGRDVGTVILPDADLKVFLVASVDERAERRFKENKSKGMTVDFSGIKADIIRRDEYDMTRKNSPLTQANDAILVDTTGLSIAEVVLEIEKLAKRNF
ncbi:(d)CMP kinase [Vagococcus vulneris]|uniref:Cytidylate kinase n=1 Tax=Vagococcus vulneris TaxID=1977869 RepID=A0A430A1W9_9ENTE|nr:(d)CMP kinase [Vagococcus vulneris]RSU00454.1 cytidylate kinase [Vagococcus vulneris]